MQPVISNGTEYKTGLKPPDKARMMARPQYVGAYPTIPQSQWAKSPGLRKLMPWVEDQNPEGSCGGHGASASHTAAINEQRVRAGLNALHLSPTYLYGQCNGGRDNGSAPDDLAQAIEEKGCCLIETVPEHDIYSRRYPPAADIEAARFKGDQLLTTNTFEEMATASIRVQSQFAGIFCGGNFNPNPDGTMPEFDGREVGGHCIAPIGELECIDGVWGIWTLNSWGPDWGKNGWCWLPRSYFDAGLPAFHGIAIISVKPDPLDSGVPPAPIAA